MFQSTSAISGERTPTSSVAFSNALFSRSTSSDHDAAKFFPGSAPHNRAQSRSSARLQHARSSIGSYNENILSGCARKRRRIDTDSEGHYMALKTSTDADDAETQLLEEAGQLPRPETHTGVFAGQTAKILEDVRNDTTRRRSTRLGMLEKATGLTEIIQTHPVKRERDTCVMKKQESSKLSTNRDGHATCIDTEMLKSEGPNKKRARFSNKLQESDKLSTSGMQLKNFRQASTKRWMSHGLYIGQDESTGSRVSQRGSKLKKPSNDCVIIQHRKFLPMPMFRGRRMIEMGRDFKLPFDVFSPLPPGQPRPEEWKKTHKSES